MPLWSRVNLPGLSGGVSTRGMKDRLAVPESRVLADFLPAITIKAKDFANEITIHNTRENDLRTEPGITREHVQNSAAVRKALGKRGIEPENLPGAEDVKKIERRLTGEERRLPGATKKPRGGSREAGRS